MQNSPHAANYCPHLTCRKPALFLKEALELKIFPIINITHLNIEETV